MESHPNNNNNNPYHLPTVVDPIRLLLRQCVEETVKELGADNERKTKNENNHRNGNFSTACNDDDEVSLSPSNMQYQQDSSPSASLSAQLDAMDPLLIATLTMGLLKEKCRRDGLLMRASEMQNETARSDRYTPSAGEMGQDGRGTRTMFFDAQATATNTGGNKATEESPVAPSNFIFAKWASLHRHRATQSVALL